MRRRVAQLDRVRRRSQSAPGAMHGATLWHFARRVETNVEPIPRDEVDEMIYRNLKRQLGRIGGNVFAAENFKCEHQSVYGRKLLLL